MVFGNRSQQARGRGSSFAVLQYSHPQALCPRIILGAGRGGPSPRTVQVGALFPKGRGEAVELPMLVPKILAVVPGQQDIKEGVDATIAVGQAGDQVVDILLDVERQPQGTVVEGHQLPDPEGQEAGPEDQHDGEDQDEDFLAGGALGPRLARRVLLRLQVSGGQAGVEAANEQPGGQDAGAEKNRQVEAKGVGAPGRGTDMLAVAALAQGDHQHHGQGQQERDPPDAAGGEPAEARRPVAHGQGPGDGQVALGAHDGQGEDAGVHGEQVQAEQEAAAQLAEVPVLRHRRAHDEGDGAEVEQVGQRQAGNGAGQGRAAGAPARAPQQRQSVHVARYAGHTHDGEDRAKNPSRRRRFPAVDRRCPGRLVAEPAAQVALHCARGASGARRLFQLAERWPPPPAPPAALQAANGWLRSRALPAPPRSAAAAAAAAPAAGWDEPPSSSPSSLSSSSAG